MAFVATYDFGYLQTRVEANLSLGLLVVATFNTFRDGSGRFNFFAREVLLPRGGRARAAKSGDPRMTPANTMPIEDQVEAAAPAARAGGRHRAVRRLLAVDEQEHAGDREARCHRRR